MRQDQGGPLEQWPTVLGSWISSLGSIPPTPRNSRLRGNLLMRCCASHRTEWWCQSAATPLPLQTQSVSGAGGDSTHPCVLGFSVVSCPWMIVMWSREGGWGWKWPMSPSWWHHHLTNYFCISKQRTCPKHWVVEHLDSIPHLGNLDSFPPSLFAESTVVLTTVVLRQPVIQIKSYFQLEIKIKL